MQQRNPDYLIEMFNFLLLFTPDSGNNDQEYASDKLICEYN